MKRKIHIAFSHEVNLICNSKIKFPVQIKNQRILSRILQKYSN